MQGHKLEKICITGKQVESDSHEYRLHVKNKSISLSLVQFHQVLLHFSVLLRLFYSSEAKKTDGTTHALITKAHGVGNREV
jgi:hypothetical protein